MIETAFKTTTLDTPVSSGLEITGITFEGGDLCKPRYPSLIDYSRAPAGVQFEPGLQIISDDPSPFTVLYSIDPSAGVVFTRGADGLPVVQSVAAVPGSGPVPGLTREPLDPTDPTTCRLTWNQAEAALPSTALRILCEPVGRPSTTPEKVDGGVYLALVHRPEESIEPIQGAVPGSSESGTIKILGTDAQGRPRYDLFVPDVLASLSPDLELEISFRVRQGETVELALLLAAVPGSDVRFETLAGQVLVQPARPAQLQSTAVSDLKEKCTIVWERKADLEADLETGQGSVSSFFLEASAGEIPFDVRVERETRRRRRMQFDPTVIQPPNCTSGGICI